MKAFKIITIGGTLFGIAFFLNADAQMQNQNREPQQSQNWLSNDISRYTHGIEKTSNQMYGQTTHPQQTSNQMQGNQNQNWFSNGMNETGKNNRMYGQTTNAQQQDSENSNYQSAQRGY